MTHIRLAVADEDSLRGALHTAWKLRVEKNRKSAKKGTVAAKRRSTAVTEKRNFH
jgi:hypothetical protein